MSRRLAITIALQLVLIVAIAGAVWLWLARPNGATITADEEVPIGGPFSLVNQDGQPVTRDSYAGKWMLIYFGYTSCPDACPLGLTTIAEALDQLPAETADKIAPVLITVDPERDTPDVLKGYVEAFSPRLSGLTGTPEQVEAALKEFRVYARKAEAQPDGSYLVDHSTFTYLMRPDGRYATHFSYNVTPESMAQKLKATVPG